MSTMGQVSQRLRHQLTFEFEPWQWKKTLTFTTTETFPHQTSARGEHIYSRRNSNERETKRRRSMSKNTTNTICERLIQFSENLATIYPEKGEKKYIFNILKMTSTWGWILPLT